MKKSESETYLFTIIFTMGTSPTQFFRGVQNGPCCGRGEGFHMTAVNLQLT